MNRRPALILWAVLCSAPLNATAKYRLLEGKYGSLDFTLNVKTAGFAENNPWFGKARENIGNAGNFWWEGSTEAGLQGTVNAFGGSELYGAYSYLYAQTVGHDNSGDTFGLTNPGEGDTEKAYIGGDRDPYCRNWATMRWIFQEDARIIRSDQDF